MIRKQAHRNWDNLQSAFGGGHDEPNSARLGSSQMGSARILAIGSILALVYYLRVGRYSDAFTQLPMFLHWSILCLIAIIGLFSILASLHLETLGAKSSRQVRKEVEKRVQEAEVILNNSYKNLEELESSMIVRERVMTRRGVDCLSIARKITLAIEKRLSQTYQLLRSRDKIELLEACELMREKLAIGTDCLDSLIDSDPIRPLVFYEWSPTLERLFEEIRGEIKKVA